MGFNWTFYDHVINLDVDERCISGEKSRNVGTGWIFKVHCEREKKGRQEKDKKESGLLCH